MYRSRAYAWIVAVVIAVSSAWANAQDAAPEPVTPAAASSTSSVDVDSRFRELEAANRKLAEQLGAQEARHAEQMRLLLDEIKQLRGQVAAPPATAPPTTTPTANTARDGGRNAEGGRGAVPSYTLSNIKADPKASLKASFGPGFELISDDGEFQLQFHQETQVDYRAFDPNGEVFAHDGFVFPRARIFFNGRVTKPIEYMISFNRGFGGFDLLDAFINVHYDDRLQFKIGRYMTPFNYEQFAIQNMWLITPERSLFTANLGLNRMLGAMFWGTILDKRADYALGIFDGPRNSYEDFNDAKDIMGYVNARPFLREDNEGSLLRDLNIGGSFAYGVQDNPMVPRSLRTASNASNAGTADRVAPPFLIFNNAVTETGQRGMWSTHLAYFHKQLSVVADYNGANISHAINDKASTTVMVPVHGYSIAAGYFLTGETVQRRTIVEPLHDFDVRPGKRGLGAVELVARFSTLDMDPVVFPTGLVDRNLWSNRAWITNLGVNWYWNKYVKLYMNWEHAEFGDPVFYAPPGKLALTNEVIWFRFQIYF